MILYTDEYLPFPIKCFSKQAKSTSGSTEFCFEYLEMTKIDVNFIYRTRREMMCYVSHLRVQYSNAFIFFDYKFLTTI